MRKEQPQERETDRLEATRRNDSHRYDDILYLPHPVSKTHPQMPISDRAAQFAPFAALTAHGAAIRETARLTDQKIELDENSKTMLDQKMQLLQEQMEAGVHPETEITYFVKDANKEGGAYKSSRGKIRKIDEYFRIIVMEEGIQIALDDVIEIM